MERSVSGDINSFLVEKLGDIGNKVKIPTPTEFIETTDASLYEVRIDDISDADNSAVSHELGITRLSPADHPLPLAIMEIFWNAMSNRLFLPLTVKPLRHSDGPQLHVLFLVDPGSPHTYLRRDALDALFPQYTGRTVTRVLVNQCITPLNISVSNRFFENVDLLGQDFDMTW
eukprot:gene30772-37179_t